MRQVTGSMTAVVKNMDRAMADMNLEKVSNSLFFPTFVFEAWINEGDC